MRAAGFVLVASLFSACASGPPTTLPEIVRQLTRSRNPSAAQVAAITGVPASKDYGPTRIPGVRLTYSESIGGLKWPEARDMDFTIADICVRVADFEQVLGQPEWPPKLVTDGGGVAYYWKLPRLGGTTVVVLSGMHSDKECGHFLHVGPKSMYPWDPDP